MVDRPVEREQRVTPLELCFDLVVVVAITQVIELMSNDLSWRGVGQGLLVLAAIWWLWTGYGWLTNLLEPEQAVFERACSPRWRRCCSSPRRPGAFGGEGVLFAVAYLVARLINLALHGVSALDGRPRTA
jgi:low temperature requirement protein LtrA